MKSGSGRGCGWGWGAGVSRSLSGCLTSIKLAVSLSHGEAGSADEMVSEKYYALQRLTVSLWLTCSLSAQCAFVKIYGY